MDALLAHYRRMAAYNKAANAVLYDAVAQLPRADYEAERPAFFRSIKGVLNHIMVGDRLWLTRFEGGSVDTADLDAILYDDFADLRAAREQEDARIIDMADGLTPEFLDGEIRYWNYQGREVTDPNAILVAHFFNHQTHHRGQAHDLLSQTDVPPPPLDMHRLLNP